MKQELTEFILDSDSASDYFPVEFAECETDTKDWGNTIKGFTLTAAIIFATAGSTSMPNVDTSCSNIVDGKSTIRSEFVVPKRRSEGFFEINFDEDTDGSGVNTGSSDQFGVAKQLSQIDLKIQELSELPNNWDGSGAVKLTPEIINRTATLLESIPAEYLEALEIEEGLFANSWGTISIEWRPNEDNVLAIEVGKSTSNFYAIINGEIIKSEAQNEITSIHADKLAISLQKIHALYYAPAAVDC